jgi:hypothetical protein
MAAKANLRAVQEGEPAPKPKSVAQAAASGDHRALLVAMRERIANTVSDPQCPPRDLAALTRRLQDIAKEIEAIDLRVRQESGADGVEGDEAWDGSAI